MIDKWGILRLQVLERDNYCCRKCYSKERPEIHHIIPRRSGGQDTLENLITYCRKCHKTVEPSRSMCKATSSKYTPIIRVRYETWKGLRALRNFGIEDDTLDDVIQRLIRFYLKKPEESSRAAKRTNKQ